VLRKIDGRLVRSFHELLRALVDRKPGDSVKVLYLRGNKEIERSVKLARLRDIYGDE